MIFHKTVIINILVWYNTVANVLEKLTEKNCLMWYCLLIEKALKAEKRKVVLRFIQNNDQMIFTIKEGKRESISDKGGLIYSHKTDFILNIFMMHWNKSTLNDLQSVT